VSESRTKNMIWLDMRCELGRVHPCIDLSSLSRGELAWIFDALGGVQEGGAIDFYATRDPHTGNIGLIFTISRPKGDEPHETQAANAAAMN